MQKLLIAILGGILLVGVGGCKSEDSSMESSNKKMTDCCSHCPGVQTAKSDGTCPMCGAKVN